MKKLIAVALSSLFAAGVALAQAPAAALDGYAALPT